MQNCQSDLCQYVLRNDPEGKRSFLIDLFCCCCLPFGPLFVRSGTAANPCNDKLQIGLSNGINFLLSPSQTGGPHNAAAKVMEPTTMATTTEANS